MNTYSWYKSRTVWTAVAMFVVGGMQAVSSLLPVGSEPYVLAFLGILTTYFHLDTAKTFGARN